MTSSPNHPLHNAEAGSHPVTSDERETQAVVRAGLRCYKAHPYFFARYGARGEAFSRSDGGYLATLVSYPQNHVTTQVEWLATMLASRGIPRWLMECHLDMLTEELTTAIPAKGARYRKLQRAGQVIRDARHAWISQPDFEAIAGLFDDSAGEGLRGAGGLLVAAVCDECCGLTNAVPSLIGWLGDPTRFSAQWCNAVTETLARARAVAAPLRDSSP